MELKKEKPYIVTKRVVIDKSYNPEYGNDRICQCGHAYHRHFDSYESMDAVGCKYCSCDEFVEAKQITAIVDSKEILIGHINKENEFMIARNITIEMLSPKSRKYICDKFLLTQDGFFKVNVPLWVDMGRVVRGKLAKGKSLEEVPIEELIKYFDDNLDSIILNKKI